MRTRRMASCWNNAGRERSGEEILVKIFQLGLLPCVDEAQESSPVYAWIMHAVKD